MYHIKKILEVRVSVPQHDGVAAIRNYADGKDNDFQAEQGNAVAWGIIAKAFEYGGGVSGELTNWDGTKKKNGWGNSR